MRDTEHIKTVGWCDSVASAALDPERVWWVERHGFAGETRVHWKARSGPDAASEVVPGPLDWRWNVGLLQHGGDLWVWHPRSGPPGIRLYPLRREGPLLGAPVDLPLRGDPCTVESLGGQVSICAWSFWPSPSGVGNWRSSAWSDWRWDPKTGRLETAPLRVDVSSDIWSAQGIAEFDATRVQWASRREDSRERLEVRRGEAYAEFPPHRWYFQTASAGDAASAFAWFSPIPSGSLMVELTPGVTPTEVRAWNTPARREAWERACAARRTGDSRGRRFGEEREVRSRAGRTHRGLRYDLDGRALWLTRELGPPPPTEDAYELAVVCPAGARWGGKLLFDVADRVLAEDAYDAMRLHGTLLLPEFDVGGERRAVLLVPGAGPLSQYIDGHDRYVHVVCALAVTPAEEERLAAHPELGLRWHRAADRPQVSDLGRLSWAVEALPPVEGD